ncbi:MAG TPA: DUF3866 family protein [Armatimonadota bacterium]|jgi:hypothetical protein
MNTAWATAISVTAPRRGRIRAVCRLDDGGEAPAVAYAALCAPIRPGDRLLLNTTAVDLSLGTGGVHFVIANASGAASRSIAAGHIMKLRYTPLQTAVLAAEEPDSPLHAILEDADSLAGAPVICCELLSQAPGVIAGLRHGGTKRTVLVMTDEAALPAAFSDVLAELREGAFVEAVITCGQAFGGDLEAVNVYSGMLVAKALGAETVVVTPGPGTVGTGTRWGTGAVAQGQAINAAAVLGGRPIAVVRASSADARTRHAGISHHALTALGRVALAAFDAAWPEPAPLVEHWAAFEAAVGNRMTAHEMPGCGAALEAFEAEWKPWSSMGRSRADDAAFFEAAAAAGLLAAQWAAERRGADGG